MLKHSVNKHSEQQRTVVVGNIYQQLQYEKHFQATKKQLQKQNLLRCQEQIKFLEQQKAKLGREITLKYQTQVQQGNKSTSKFRSDSTFQTIKQGTDAVSRICCRCASAGPRLPRITLQQRTAATKVMEVLLRFPPMSNEESPKNKGQPNFQAARTFNSKQNRAECAKTKNVSFFDLSEAANSNCGDKGHLYAETHTEKLHEQHNSRDAHKHVNTKLRNIRTILNKREETQVKLTGSRQIANRKKGKRFIT